MSVRMPLLRCGRGLAPLGRGLVRGAFVAMVAAMLVGCEKKEQASSSSQVVARIGKDVVTTQELENEFRANNVSLDKQSDPNVVRQVLGGLVVRKYVVQQALAAGLDREPSVLLDVLRSREQVLENAYLNRRASGRSPGRADIDQFIANNPSRFAGRKLFNIEQISLPITPEAQSFVEANKQAKSLDEVDQALSETGLMHVRQLGLLNSSDLNPDYLTAIEQRKPDEVFFVRAGTTGVFFKVTGEQARPLAGEAAANMARQLMRADAVKAEAGLAAYAANIEVKYEGDYAKAMQRDDGPQSAIRK